MKQSFELIFTANYNQLFGSDPNVVKSVNEITNNFHKLAKANGISKAIDLHKETERHMKMVLMSQPSVFDQSIMWTKTEGGLPKFVRFRKEFMKKPEYARAMLTAIAYYRLYTKPIDSDLSSITDRGPELSEELLNNFEQFASEFFRDRGIKPFEPIEDPYPAYATTKAGANGPSAMALTSLKDILALERDGILPKIQSFSERVYTNCEDLKTLISDSLTIARTNLEDGVIQNLDSLITGRLHLLAEGGGKTRVICIPDVWTQSVMKPIHNYLMNVLKRMPCDGSFGHNVLGDRVRKYTKRRGLYCFDLTTVTDRLPLTLQKRVLRPLLGDTVHEWGQLLTNRKFAWNRQAYEYAVGQPMGILSSWAAMSITHHIIINYAKGDKSFYAMIGDDMGMSSKEGARKYQNLISELGMSINDRKSLVPVSDEKIAEIAKRQFIGGVEISPIPPRVLVESTRDLSGLLEFLEVYASRTGKFKTCSELEHMGVLRLIKQNLKYDTPEFQVLLTCPLEEYNPLGIYSNFLAPLKEGITSKWNTSIPVQTIMHEIEQYILNVAVNKINEYHLLDNPMMMGSVNSSRSRQSLNSPLLRNYFGKREEELKSLLRTTLAHHEHDDWDDDHVSSPNDVYEALISGPDPLAPKEFMEKRVIRRKRTIDLINKYYSWSRFARG